MKKDLPFICGAALAIIAPFWIQAQENKIPVVGKLKQQKQFVLADSANKMVELKHSLPDLQYQLYYASEKNFMHKKLYASGKRTFLRFPVVKALKNVQEELAQKGYGIKIWDAYRPYQVTKKMWSMVHDERYVANPAYGSGHNRGLAVDLTLFDLKTGAELDMGTGFDNFTDSAHHSFRRLLPVQQQNRSLLKTTMEQHGFKTLDTEWWHYSWQGRSFAILDLSFRQLARLAD